MVMPETLYLVSCVSGKAADPTRARDLYVSQWFRFARQYVEAAGGPEGSPWFILSAQHGLLAPDRIVAPYERTLATMGVTERRAWAADVRAQMERELPNAARCVVLAGERYREFLMDYLEARFTTEVPMRGLAIGRQLQWLQRQISAHTPHA
jgi:hypothetical protein